MMAREAGRALVVDASVARAVGTSEHPISSACRQFLDEMKSICNRLVHTPDLSEEWQRHASPYWRKWLASMHARRQVLWVTDARDDDLRRRLSEAVETEKKRAAVAKDAHLVEAALASEQAVISLDDSVRALLVEAAVVVTALRPITWVNPVHAREDAQAWLRAGAPVEPARCLGTAHESTNS